jgi:hypothetical protein
MQTKLCAPGAAIAQALMETNNKRDRTMLLCALYPYCSSRKLLNKLYSTFYDISMGHYTWFVVACNDLSSTCSVGHCELCLTPTLCCTSHSPAGSIRARERLVTWNEAPVTVYSGLRLCASRTALTPVSSQSQVGRSTARVRHGYQGDQRLPHLCCLLLWQAGGRGVTM